MACCALLNKPLQAAPQTLDGLAGESANAGLAFFTLDNGLRYRHEHVPHSSHTCVLLGVRTGMNHDPIGQTGLARVLEWSLRLLKDARPASEWSQVSASLSVTTLGPATIASLTVRNRDVPRVMRFYADLLGGKLELSDDLLVLATAKARLRADDEAEEIPGMVHFWRARRALLAGDPRGRQGCGIADEMAEFKPTDLRARHRAVFRPQNAFLVTVGGLGPESIKKLVLERFAALTLGERKAPALVRTESTTKVELRIENHRADAVFQTAALRAPGASESDFIPFLLAMHLTQVGIIKERWRFRGGEAQAAFTPFVFSMLENPGVVLINRRGENGGDPERPRREIESILARLREGVLMVPDIKRAVLSVARALQLPPYDSHTSQLLASQPRMLRQPAYVVALYELWHWPADLSASIYQVKLRRVGEVLKESLRREQVLWIRTVPARDDAANKKDR